MKPRVVLLVGDRRTGKDTIGEYLAAKDFHVESFAAPLYDCAESLSGIRQDELEDDELAKDRILPAIGRSARDLVNNIGDFARAELGDSILIQRLVARCHDAGVCVETRGASDGAWTFQRSLVITDGRLELELAWARAVGASVWWIVRPRRPADELGEELAHRTGRIFALHRRCYQAGDVTLANDSTLDDLFAQVDQALEITAPEVA